MTIIYIKVFTLSNTSNWKAPTAKIVFVAGLKFGKNLYLRARKELASIIIDIWVQILFTEWTTMASLMGKFERVTDMKERSDRFQQLTLFQFWPHILPLLIFVFGNPFFFPEDCWVFEGGGKARIVEMVSHLRIFEMLSHSQISNGILDDIW